MREEEVLQDRSGVRDRLQELMDAVERSRVLAEARPHVLDLADLLPDHFHHEEVRVYPALLEAWPDLAPVVERLRQEHEDLIDRFGALVLEMPDDGVILPTAAVSIPPALRALREHERAEVELLTAARRRASVGAAS